MRVFGVDRLKYGEQVWDMIQLSYAHLTGGFASSDSLSDLLAVSSEWQLTLDSNERPIAAIIYRDRYGLKSIAACSDRTRGGIVACHQMIADDAKQNKSWIEVSGATVRLMVEKHRLPIIPSVFAGVLTGKPIISLNPNGIQYTRQIGGHVFEKMMVGTIRANSSDITNIQAHGLDITKINDNSLIIAECVK